MTIIMPFAPTADIHLFHILPSAGPECTRVAESTRVVTASLGPCIFLKVHSLSTALNSKSCAARKAGPQGIEGDILLIFFPIISPKKQIV